MKRLAAMTFGLFLVACSDDAGDVALIEAPVCVEHSPTLFGIDVSKWQGTIDWAKVKNAGVKYAFIRVSDGVTTIDEKFPANWQGAAANGIPRGVYQFFRPNRDALEQAQIVLDHLEQYGMGELPPVIDVEATGDQTPAVVAQKVGQWIDAIEGALGVRPIIYSGSYFWDDNVGSTAFSDYHLWIPHYTTAACPRLPAAWADWKFWQYSSSGSVNGIAGNVDVNRFAGTEEDLLALVPDEPCRLDPDYRACADDVATNCVDGRLVDAACPEGSSCRGSECVVDAPEPGPEPSPEVVEVVEVVEIAEPPPEVAPEVVEPTPEVIEPDTTVPDSAGAEVGEDASSPGAHAGVPSRSVQSRTVTPSEGCAGGTSPVSAVALALAIIALTRLRRRRSSR